MTSTGTNRQAGREADEDSPPWSRKSGQPVWQSAPAASAKREYKPAIAWLLLSQASKILHRYLKADGSWYRIIVPKYLIQVESVTVEVPNTLR